ncbi:MAG: hypothetical protein ACK56Y_02770 [Pseudanabaena sp.]
MRKRKPKEKANDDEEIASLAISQDARTLISGSWDETLKCWDIATGNCLQTLRSIRPYEGMIIDGAANLTEAQIATLKALGANA